MYVMSLLHHPSILEMQITLGGNNHAKENHRNLFLDRFWWLFVC